MKMFLPICRYCVLAILATATLLCILAVPGDDLSNDSWVNALVFSKITGLSAGYLSYKLAKRWKLFIAHTEKNIHQK